MEAVSRPAGEWAIEFDRLDTGLPISNVKTLGVRIDESLPRERMIANIATAFGIVALTLAPDRPGRSPHQRRRQASR